MDAGNTWVDVTNNLGLATTILDLTIDPIDSNIVYVAMYGQCGGIWKTTNGGTTWNSVSGGCDFYRIAIAPSNHNIIYAGSLNLSGYFIKSTDGGNLWTNPGNQGLGSVGAVRGIAIDPNNSSIIYAGTEINGILKSIDGGANWTFLSNSPSITVASVLTVNPINGTIYSRSSTGVSESTDGGDTWISIDLGQIPPFTGIYRLVVFPNHINSLYATSTTGIYVYGPINSQPINLNVPAIKQTSNPWQSDIYDTANKWAPSSPTINSWGCALTSATMVLNYHGINKLPNGTNLNPGNLNNWLKNQKDGYIGTGWINWLAISRLSRLAKSINNITTFDALQYNRTGNGDKNKLTVDINNLLPDILEVTGHLIVAKGINGTTFNINDPYYSRNTLNDYSNTFSTLGTYTPSYTDLSYIMLNTDSNIRIALKDSNGNAVGESFIQQPLLNDSNPPQTNSHIQIFYLPKPNGGNYTLQLSSNNKQNYNLNVYFYNIDGEVKITNIKGDLNKNKQDNFVLNFDKNKLKNNYIKHKSKERELEDEIDEVREWLKDLF